jgi:phage antirepressor YoqD-like protein
VSKKLQKANSQMMTIKEIADVLEMSDDPIYRSAKELFPAKFQTGKTTYFDEAEVTAIKLNLRKNAEVVNQPKTDAEKKLMTVGEVADVLGVTAEALKWHIRKIFPDLLQNGVTTYLNEEQITTIKRKMLPTSQLVGAITDIEASEMLLMASKHFEARFAQEREARLKAENKLVEVQPKVNVYDKLVDANHVTGIRDTANEFREYGIRERQFVSLLLEFDLLYRNPEGELRFYANQGDYFVLKDTPCYGGGFKPLVHVTMKGKQHLLQVFKDAGVIK